MEYKENTEIISGEELYRRFLEGDKGAFDELVELYENELSYFIHGIVHDYHEAKHLMIETFAQLVISGGKFAGKSSLKTYIFTIGKNLAFRYRKMRASEQHLSYEDAIEVLVDDEDTPEHYMEREENKHYLHEAIKDLKEEYREVLELLYFEDMSYLEAARVMDKSEKQISNLAYRAKAALKKRLENVGFTYV